MTRARLLVAKPPMIQLGLDKCYGPVSTGPAFRSDVSPDMAASGAVDLRLCGPSADSLGPVDRPPWNLQRDLPRSTRPTPYPQQLMLGELAP
jgi:hypothetical protein